MTPVVQYSFIIVQASGRLVVEKLANCEKDSDTKMLKKSRNKTQFVLFHIMYGTLMKAFQTFEYLG